MEAIIGLIAGTITYIYYYRKFIRIKKTTIKIKEVMDEQLQKIVIDRMNKMESKFDGFEKRLNDLEVTLKVALANLQGKVARNASFVTAGTMIIVLIIKEFLFK